jgi:hypothetical protein
MATFNKFFDFVEQIGLETHQLNTDTLKVYLTNAIPDQTADTVKSDLAEITMTNEANHGAGGADTTNTWAETGGTATAVGTDVTFLASGGTVGPFRYAVLYNDTAVSDNLIGWWDYGSSITLQDGESFTVDFGASMFTIT